MTRENFNSINLKNKFETENHYKFVFSYAYLDERPILERITDTVDEKNLFNIYSLSFNIEKDDVNYETIISFEKTD